MAQPCPDDRPDHRPRSFQGGERGRDHALEAPHATEHPDHGAFAVQIRLPGDQVVPARVGGEVNTCACAAVTAASAGVRSNSTWLKSGRGMFQLSMSTKRTPDG